MHKSYVVLISLTFMAMEILIGRSTSDGFSVVPLFSISKPGLNLLRVFATDIYGDHVVLCVGIKHRHNAVRDTLVDICYRSGISASKKVDIGLDRGVANLYVQRICYFNHEMKDLMHVGISAGKEVDIALDGGRDKPLCPVDMLLYSWMEDLMYAISLLKQIQKFSMTQDIGARVVVHIFNRTSFAIAKGVRAGTGYFTKGQKRSQTGQNREQNWIEREKPKPKTISAIEVLLEWRGIANMDFIKLGGGVSRVDDGVLQGRSMGAKQGAGWFCHVDYRLNPFFNAIKYARTCEALYTTDYCCSKGGLVDKIICDLNKTPDSSQRPPPIVCAKCGNPVDGPYCRGCALLRKKFKEDLFTYCVENGIFQDLQDTSESSNDNTNVVMLSRAIRCQTGPVKNLAISSTNCRKLLLRAW
ncbi:hypothetical protein Tco_0153962 [Tanacetum coccineum]